MRRKKFISFFTGIAGFDLGFERAGMECVAQVENNRAAIKVLEYHYPDVMRFKDIRDVRASDLPSADVWCGGFPCQDLSISGDRAGLAGSRSGLWYEFIRLIREALPRLVVIENVTGLLSSNKGRDLAIILQGLVACGYRVCWRVLDAQHFRLAQRRKRVFIVASLGDGRAAEILFEPTGVQGGAESSGEEGEEVAATLGASAPSRRNGGSNPTKGHFVAHSLKGEGNWKADGSDNFIVGTLAASGAGTARTAGQANEADMLVYGLTHELNASPDMIGALQSDSHNGGGSPPMVGVFNGLRSDEFRAASVASTLAARDYKSARDLIVEAIDVRNMRSNGDLSGTLQAKATGGHSLNYQNPVAFNWNISAASNRVDPVRKGHYAGTVKTNTQDAVLLREGVRRLTPLECERLQGFPDGWTAVIGKGKQRVPPSMLEYLRTQYQRAYGATLTDDEVRRLAADATRYRQLGNAVAVPVIEWLGRRIVESG